MMKIDEPKGTSKRASLAGLAACLLFVAAGSFGCTVVKPWDRELLARPDMAFDSDPLQTALRDHVYYSKEATPPGGGGGGGGCGCN